MADTSDCLSSTGEHFVDVALMGDVKEELIGGGVKDAMEGDGEFDDAEIRAEMAAGIREGIDEDLADLFGKLRKVLGRDCFEVVGLCDLAQERGFRRV